MHTLTGLKKTFVLALLVVYAITTPIMSASHVHTSRGLHAVASYQESPQRSIHSHSLMCEICYRISTSTSSVVSTIAVAGDLPSFRFAPAESIRHIAVQELSTVPARAPPSSPIA